jgi:hypothetical protein
MGTSVTKIKGKDEVSPLKPNLQFGQTRNYLKLFTFAKAKVLAQHIFCPPNLPI